MNEIMTAVLVIWFLGGTGGSFLLACDRKNAPQFYARALLWPLFLVIWLLRGLLLALAEDLGIRKNGE